MAMLDEHKKQYYRILESGASLHEFCNYVSSVVNNPTALLHPSNIILARSDDYDQELISEYINSEKNFDYNEAMAITRMVEDVYRSHGARLVYIPYHTQTSSVRQIFQIIVCNLLKFRTSKIAQKSVTKTGGRQRPAATIRQQRRESSESTPSDASLRTMPIAKATTPIPSRATPFLFSSMGHPSHLRQCFLTRS